MFCLWPAVLLSLPACGEDAPRAEPMPVEGVRSVNLPVEEPSGIAYHAQRDSLLVVSDEGLLVELDREFSVRGRYVIGGDLEGVAVHPATGTVLVASESQGAVFEFDPDAGKIIRTLKVDYAAHPDFAGARERNRGMEGVAVVPSGTEQLQLLVVNESGPKRVLRLAADLSPEATGRARESAANGAAAVETVRIDTVWPVELSNLSDIVYDAPTSQFLIPSARDGVLRILDADFRALRTIRLPGSKQEGLCFLPNGDGVVVQDSGNGYLCPGLRAALFPK